MVQEGGAEHSIPFFRDQKTCALFFPIQLLPFWSLKKSLSSQQQVHGSYQPLWEIHFYNFNNFDLWILDFGNSEAKINC